MSASDFQRRHGGYDDTPAPTLDNEARTGTEPCIRPASRGEAGHDEANDTTQTRQPGGNRVATDGGERDAGKRRLDNPRIKALIRRYGRRVQIGGER